MRTIGCVIAVLVFSSTVRADDKAKPADDKAKPAEAKLNLEAGQWRIARLFSFGSKHELSKSKPTLECLSADALVPSPLVGWPAGTKCPQSKDTPSGSTTVWKFQCSNPAEIITGSGTLTYAGKKFSGTINLETSVEDNTGLSARRGLLKISGAYVGPCPAPAK